MSDPQMFVVGGRRGRKKRFDGTPVSVRLPRDLHDALSIEAIRRRLELSEVIRERLNQPIRISKNTKA